MKPEWISLAVNLVACAYYIWHGDEVGKILYWGAAAAMAASLVLMKG